METNLKNGSLKKLIVNYVGSKNNLDPLHISNEILELDSETLQIISEHFLNKFSGIAEYYSFHHTSSLQYNEVYNYVRDILGDEETFVQTSGNIAHHLYESSTHPKVKGGELYIGFFENLPVEGRMFKAVGLFKTENKSLFLEAQHTNSQFQLQIKEGVELTKIDKGCLIINTKQEEGFDVLIFDNQNRGEEALYWKEKFLNLKAQKNEYHQTAHFLTLTRQFITGQMESEFNMPKTDQIELLHKSMDYFKSKESFNMEEFQTEVFQQTEMIESFKNFGSRYIEHHDVDIASNFDISAQAVQKQNRIFKSVLKLDKNFHVYIHGNTDLIEKGVDIDGRKFYKLYYKDES